MIWVWKIELGDIVISLLTLITIGLVFYWNYKQYNQLKEQLKVQNEQIKLNFFSEYIKEYREIILHFPENINERAFSYESLDKEKQDNTMRYMRAYFDLCSEEFFLHKNKFIDDKVWK